MTFDEEILHLAPFETRDYYHVAPNVNGGKSGGLCERCVLFTVLWVCLMLLVLSLLFVGYLVK